MPLGRPPAATPGPENAARLRNPLSVVCFALGAGNPSLVAGGLSFRTTLNGTTPYASFQKVKLTLAPPIPSLSPAGLAAGGALVLLAAGYALRRRFG